MSGQDPREHELDASLSATATVNGGEARASVLLERGAVVGRYIIVDMIGEGAMGSVYQAYDPELDRRIALKFLKTAAHDAAGESSSERILREAQALARLSHPNVVSVYDTGTFADSVYVSLELVSGATLRDWLKAPPRGLREIVDVFLQAGRGLAAAHAAGIVHRDFKPANVIVGADGRARVLDFGLAHSETAGTSVARELHATSSGQADDSLRSQSMDTVSRTQAGLLIGTPAYMSPEQHRAAPVDARSDQFSFCVALYGALFGTRPFEGSGLAELRDNVLDGCVRPPPPGSRVPKRLIRIIRRGLEVDPADRYPSMDALLTELAADPRTRRRWIASVAAAAMVPTAAAAGLWLASSRSEPPCVDLPPALGELWTAPDQDRVRQGFAATGRAHSEDTFARLSRALSGFADDWGQTYRETCRATHVRHEQSEALLDRKMHCLYGRLEQMSQLVEVLGNAPKVAAVDRSLAAISNLRDLSPCDDAAVLNPTAPPPASAAQRQLLKELRRDLGLTEVLSQAGDYAAAGELVASVVKRARDADYPPVLAEALVEQGALQSITGEVKQAETTLAEAIDLATAAKDARLLTRAWTWQIFVVGYQGGAHERAVGMMSAAEQALGFADGDRRLRADLLVNQGQVHTLHGEHADATAALEEAVSILEDVHGPRHLKVAAALGPLGNATYHAGDPTRANEFYRRTHDIRLELQGPTPPLIVHDRINLGAAYDGMENYEAAAEHFAAAVELGQATYGREHYVVGIAHNNYGEALRRQRAFDDAEAHLRAALRIWEGSLGAEHPLLGHPLTGLGNLEVDRGNPHAAVPLLERALAVRQGDGQVQDLAATRLAMARALWDQGQRSRAREFAAAAMAAADKAGKAGTATRDEIAAWLAERGAG